MDTVTNCWECANYAHCLELIRKGIVVYCGSSMCNPKSEDETE